MDLLRIQLNRLFIRHVLRLSRDLDGGPIARAKEQCRTESESFWHACDVHSIPIGEVPSTDTASSDGMDAEAAEIIQSWEHYSPAEKQEFAVILRRLLELRREHGTKALGEVDEVSDFIYMMY